MTTEPPRDTPIISPENQPTIIAVAFVLALLALSMNFFNYHRTTQVAYVIAAFELRDESTDQAEAAQLRKRIRELEDRIAALEAVQTANNDFALPE